MQGSSYIHRDYNTAKPILILINTLCHFPEDGRQNRSIFKKCRTYVRHMEKYWVGEGMYFFGSCVMLIDRATAIQIPACDVWASFFPLIC